MRFYVLFYINAVLLHETVLLRLRTIRHVCELLLFPAIYI